jgi:hypothetical protein
MPEHYDLTLLDPDGKRDRDIALMRAEIEELRAKLARMPAVIARAALGIIFSTKVIQYSAELVVPDTLMEPWATVVSAVAVGLVSSCSCSDCGCSRRKAVPCLHSKEPAPSFRTSSYGETRRNAHIACSFRATFGIQIRSARQRQVGQRCFSSSEVCLFIGCLLQTDD